MHVSVFFFKKTLNRTKTLQRHWSPTRRRPSWSLDRLSWQATITRPTLGTQRHIYFTASMQRHTHPRISVIVVMFSNQGTFWAPAGNALAAVPGVQKACLRATRWPGPVGLRLATSWPAVQDTPSKCSVKGTGAALRVRCTDGLVRWKTPSRYCHISSVTEHILLSS